MEKNSKSDFYVSNFMDLSKYSLIRAKLDDKWDKFVAASEYGTIFSRKAFLEAFSAKFGLWYCIKNNQIRVALVVVETEDGLACRSLGYLVHNGIIFPAKLPDQNLSQVNSEQFATMAFIVQELGQIYSYIEFTNYHFVNDLRPFSWHNYHNDKPKVAVDVRYTSILKLPKYSEITEGSDFFASFNTLRRRIVRKGIKENTVTKPEYNLDLFIELHKSTFERQDLSVDQSGIELLKSIISNLQENNMIRGFSSYDADGNLGTILIFGVDGKRAYYLYGGSNPDVRSANTGTIAFWDAFKYLAQENIQEVDFEGINSPERGYFKLSFGGTITPYYRVSWQGDKKGG